MNVIVYTNDNGGVAVCIPTGEISIEDVLSKDCPSHAIIIDDSLFPSNLDFIGAWELNGETISINIEKAKSYYLNKYNLFALKVAQQRQLNTLAGIENIINDNDWQEQLNADRKNISIANTISDLLLIPLLSE